jgi:hypothetical protein
MSEAGTTRRIERSPSTVEKTRTAAKRFWIGLGVALALAILLALLIAPEANQGFADDAAVLAFLAATAVAIERTIELVWTLLSRRQGFGAWWPLNEVVDHVQRVEGETNQLVTSVLGAARRSLEQAREAGGRTQDEIARIERGITELNRQQERLAGKLGTATQLAPGSPRLRLVAEVADDARRHITRTTSAAGEARGEVRDQLDVAMNAIDDAVAFIGAFEENPARRIASLALGATLGVLVAGLLGLNVFVATLGGAEDVEGVAGVLAGALGVVITGAILGFGAEPTHHVIKGLQRYKERNTADEEIATGAGEVRVTAAAAPGVAPTGVAPTGVAPTGATPAPAGATPASIALTGVDLALLADEAAEAEEADEAEVGAAPRAAAPVAPALLPPAEVTRVRRIRSTR